MAEINDKKDAIWSNVKNLQQKILVAGVNDYSADLDVPLLIWLFCGLLKSKNSLIRWGFLYVFDRLLVRCKVLLDERKIPHLTNEVVEQSHDKTYLEKANAVIDIMSAALSLVAEINEMDHLNILKMCYILFSQLCLVVLPSDSVSCGNDDAKSGISCGEDPVEETKGKFGSKNDTLINGRLTTPRTSGCAHAIGSSSPCFFVLLAFISTRQCSNGVRTTLHEVSVGIKGRGNIPGATSDIRATLLLLLLGKCTAEPTAF